MKKLYHFLPMLILSLFTIIFVIVFEACFFISNTLLDPDIYNEAMSEKNVSQSMYDEIVTYFKSLSNATGIPPEVFTDPIDKDQLYTTSFKLLTESLNYISDKDAPKPSPNYDFTAEEESITGYIEKHAEENNIERNKEYQKLVKNTVETAKSQISSRFDTMMLYTLAKSGAGESLHNYSYLFSVGIYVSAALVLILIVIMIVIDRNHPRDYPYWIGLIMSVSAAFWLIPAAYLKSTRYFDAFFVRDTHVYKTVTGMFEIALDRIIKLHLILLIIGVLLITSTLVIHYSYLHYLKVKYKQSGGSDSGSHSSHSHHHHHHHHHHHSDESEKSDEAENSDDE